ncbi:MAG TPA: alpha/beta hydrolase family protein [Fimbriimonadaceae bacterium]|nr:alpha/beta hydrolase family protein [Fimbriimonadaceae bacterium]
MLFALLLGACLTLAQEPQVAQAPPPIQFPDWKEVDRSATAIEYTVSFPSAMETPYPANNTVPLRVLTPINATGPIPAVVVLHYWGTRDLKVERALAAELNRHGIAAVLMTLPYHLTRTPPGYVSGELALEPDPDLIVQNLVQSVWDVRRTIDWIASRSEFDPSRMGIAGSSLGAVVATLAYGIDHRLSAATFVLGGVDLAHIIWASSRTVREREMLRKHGYTEDKLREALASVEPKPFLETRTGGTAFVIGANYDTVMPRGSSDELIKALGHPKTLFVDTGHYGGIFVERRLLREAGNFFGSEFAGKDFVPPSRIYAPTVRIGGIANTATGFDLVAGLDLIKFDRRGDGFATLLISPRGPELFVGRRIDSRISFGVLGTRRTVGVGLFWSTVL